MARLNVRARAVDFLGRQQVAGIPTAISELFKNAHDAYADRDRLRDVGQSEDSQEGLSGTIRGEHGDQPEAAG